MFDSAHTARSIVAEAVAQRDASRKQHASGDAAAGGGVATHFLANILGEYPNACISKSRGRLTGGRGAAWATLYEFDFHALREYYVGRGTWCSFFDEHLEAAATEDAAARRA